MANEASSKSLIENFVMHVSDCISGAGRAGCDATRVPGNMNTVAAETFPIREPLAHGTGVPTSEYDQRFMQMNEIRRAASDRVQCALPNVTTMIDGTDHPGPPDHPTLTGDHHDQDHFRGPAGCVRARGSGACRDRQERRGSHHQGDAGES